MLRPERMSRVSVTGAKRVLTDTIETVHRLDLLHVTGYDGEWEGFEPGDPVAGADEAADRLVTVRSLISLLDVDQDRETSGIDLDGMGDRIETVRTRANELDDRREDLEGQRADLADRIDALEPLTALGIDLDLLSGYDSLETRVGEADEAAVREALDSSERIDRYELFTEDRAVAVFAEPAPGETAVLDDALTGTEFVAVDVPDAEGSPEDHLDDLEGRRSALADDVEDVEAEIREVRDEHGDFLLAAEEELAIEVQRREAPLSFATTKNAFVAEGWVPTDRFDDLESRLREAVGDHVVVEELEQASYNSDGHVTEREPTESGGDGGSSDETEAEVAADGGTDVAIGKRDPPVVQDNPGPVKPFEFLVKTVSRPKYSEIDPSIVLFLTLPLMFGFMIGDAGYGLVYLTVGTLLFKRFESDGIRALGAITLWAGGFTFLFGILYGEIFGTEFIKMYLWEGALGLESQPLHKGLMPTYGAYANAWLLISVLFGLLHMTVGYLFDFADNLRTSFKTAMLESGSYLILMLGVWVWLMSRTLMGVKPELMFVALDGQPFALGFAGFSPTVGWAGLGVGLVVGLGLVIVNEVNHFGGIGILVGFLEGLLRAAFVNPLSYTRLAAEVLAEVGLAFAVNLLVFGAYEHNGEFHLLFTHGPGYVQTLGGDASLMFGGLIHMGIAGAAFGMVLLVVGHMLVLGVGVMSAGLQAVRLEYVEFFNQFYEGGGDQYEPFGYERTHTLEE